MSETKYKIPVMDKICSCKLCVRGRRIREIAALLPEAESAELLAIVAAMLDDDADKDMRLAYAEGRLPLKAETVI